MRVRGEPNVLHEAIVTQERQAGKDHPFVAWALNWLGVIALKRGNLAEAEADFQRMSQIYQATYGGKDRHAALAQLRFGELYMAKHDYPAAAKCFRDSAQLYLGTGGKSNVQTGVAQIELGGALLGDRQYDEAKEQLLAGLRAVTQDGDLSPEAAADARRDLVIVYEALNRPDKAREFRARAGN